MLTISRRESLCKKYNINIDMIKYKTYLVMDENNFIDIIGVELELIPLQISVKCNMSYSITFNFKRCLKMIRCILDKYNVE